MDELDRDSLSTLVSMSQDLDVLIPLIDSVLKNPSYPKDLKIHFYVLVSLYSNFVFNFTKNFIEENNLKKEI